MYVSTKWSYIGLSMHGGILTFPARALSSMPRLPSHNASFNYELTIQKRFPSQNKSWPTIRHPLPPSPFFSSTSGTSASASSSSASSSSPSSSSSSSSAPHPLELAQIDLIVSAVGQRLVHVTFQKLVIIGEDEAATAGPGKAISLVCD